MFVEYTFHCIGTFPDNFLSGLEKEDKCVVGTHQATSCTNTSRWHIGSDKSLRAYWRIFVKIFVAAKEFCRRNKSHKFSLIWFFATCCSDKILLRRQRFSQNFCTHEAICRCDVSPHCVAATSSPTCSHGMICRRDVLLQLVAKCVPTFKKTIFYSCPLFTETCIWVSKESKSPFCGMAFIKLLTMIHKSWFISAAYRF